MTNLTFRSQSLSSSTPKYRGRFAPSPTGPLHFGSLVAAVASYADALHHQGDWLLRFDDIDEMRVRPGAVDAMLFMLETLGFEWSEPPTFQTRRLATYQEVLDGLLATKIAFHCGCSRKEIGKFAQEGPEGSVYPGTCRNGVSPGKIPRSVRVKVDDQTIGFRDRFVGYIKQNLKRDVGDFVIRRSDGFIAYQLAVVVDDAMERITHVVRGADLLLSTPRQIYLHQLLGFTNPMFGHVPLVLDRTGKKLSKQNAAQPLLGDNPLDTLSAAWRFLGQKQLQADIVNTTEFWSETSRLWSPTRFPITPNRIRS